MQNFHLFFEITFIESKVYQNVLYKTSKSCKNVQFLQLFIEKPLFEFLAIFFGQNAKSKFTSLNFFKFSCNRAG